MPFHAGTIGLVGRPNAGKSSLLNVILGERIAAVSHHPQTTRNRIVGIHTTEQLQVVLVDTPGIHRAWTELNRKMVAVAEEVFDEVDLICWIIDVIPLVEAVQKGEPVLDEGLIAIRDKLAGRKVVVVLNKIDRVEKPFLLPVIEQFKDVGVVVPVSAQKRENLNTLLDAWTRLLPEQEALYPADYLTDAPERFVVAELIRERIFAHTSEEVPYATAVEVERFDERMREAGHVHIYAKIIVEKPSQKAIIIGKGGQMIKRIGTEARSSIERLLGCHVRLELFVVVEKDWTKNPRALRELGYK